MVVYQSLKRLAPSVKVVTILDDSEYRKERDPEPETRDHNGAGNLNVSKVCIGDPANGAVAMDGEQEGWMDPEEVVVCEVVRDANGKFARDTNGRRVREYTTHYHRRRVTWLNYSPDSRASKELAVAFITVRGSFFLFLC